MSVAGRTLAILETKPGHIYNIGCTNEGWAKRGLTLEMEMVEGTERERRVGRRGYAGTAVWDRREVGKEKRGKNTRPKRNGRESEYTRG